MDVQCERCGTEYEFDDALVSGRGTTVRCTHCGHQFKVRRAQATGPTEDQWLIRTADGEQLTFLTLRDLQHAILSKRVRRTDGLLRGAGPFRPLGSITELEPFFEGRVSNRPPGMDAGPPEDAVTAPAMFPKTTLAWQGEGASQAFVMHPAMAPTPVPTPGKTTDFYRSPAAAQAPVSSAAPSTPMRGKMDTLRPPLSAAAAPPPPSFSDASEADAPGGQALDPAAPPPWANDVGPEPVSVVTRPVPVDAALPPPTQPVRRPFAPPPEEDIGSLRPGPPSSEDPYSAPRRRNVGGWVVALVLLLAIGVVGWALAKPYLVAHDAGATPQVDPRVQPFLTQGEAALMDGNLDVAQEDFDKASALAEKDPRVLLDEARVVAAKADIPWLKLRLLAPDASDEIRTTRAELDESVVRVRRSADDAVQASPDDVAAIRAKIDALRIAGERDAARALVSKVTGAASQPDTAYVLAALDLAEPAPLWTTVIERLRLAAASRTSVGRVESALTYALVQSGDVASARAELSKIDALARPYPLLPPLHAFLEKHVQGGSSASAVARVEPSSKSGAAVHPGSPAPAPAPAVAVAAPQDLTGDARSAMQAAATALRKADFPKARQYYQAVVERNPNDSEAIAGLGDVARLQGDSAAAIAAYKRAIAVNPSYLPALVGLGDTQWSSGNKGAATKTYADIVDRFPEGTYPAYVSQRAKEPPPAPAAATEPTGAAAPPTTDERTE